MIKNKEYSTALEIAKDNLADLKERGSEALGDNALEFMNSILSPEEIAESDLRVSLMKELIVARREKGYSQKDLEKISGVKQPVIAKMESGKSSPRISTILKLLIPLGKTLAVVPLKENKFNKAERKK